VNILEGNFARKSSVVETDEYEAFSFGRVGNKPQFTLLCRKATGEVEGFSYADYRGVSAIDEENGFSVKFGAQKVRIEGRHLGQLFRYVCNLRAAEIVATDEHTAMRLPDGKAVVWRVNW
jgi:hypothetical protein